MRFIPIERKIEKASGNIGKTERAFYYGVFNTTTSIRTTGRFKK